MKNLAITSLLVWMLAALIGGWFDIFSQQPGVPPITLGLFIVLPILYFTALYRFSPAFKEFAHNISLPLIVGAHIWRFVGAGFLVAYYFGRLPGQFAIPAGVGDIIVALLAIPLALALHQRKPVRGAFIAWNVFGLIDLLAAISLGILYSKSAFGVLRTDISTALMTTFPVNLIPAFFVPLFIMLHVLSLLRYREVKAV